MAQEAQMKICSDMALPLFSPILEKGPSSHGALASLLLILHEKQLGGRRGGSFLADGSRAGAVLHLERQKKPAGTGGIVIRRNRHLGVETRMAKKTSILFSVINHAL
ncbi:hypothetical protein [Cohnella sp. REN36]|uniref:hypothetical protein n=1 Tax=Cohnella sp. REN36 TaxID=2887347 RepID=UPI001D14DC3F|nr:hypothetical protein [Cohnella sp. REN36]MCC3375184.1 hypothetical protein [Cohnella sp. REN36]